MYSSQTLTGLIKYGSEMFSFGVIAISFDKKWYCSPNILEATESDFNVKDFKDFL